MNRFWFLLFFFSLPISHSEVIRQPRFRELLQFQQRDGYVDISLFIDPLPIPNWIRIPRGQRSITLPMKAGFNTFYGDLAATPIWGFMGTTPGPTIEVESGQDLEVRWKSELPERHLLPSHSDRHSAGLPEVRNVVHLHGASVPESSIKDRFHNNDGWPDDWVTPGQTQIAHYPNQQTSRMLWYHDHAMGATARNVYSGLFGSYVIRDPLEKKLKLPSGDYEIPLIFESKDFNDDGTLTYPEVMSAEVYGSTVPVNGKICPYLRVEPRKYRFRFLNAASARSFALKFVDTLDESDGPALIQIGSDGGFLQKPVVLNNPSDPNSQRLKLAPAERADVIVDFSRFKGKVLLLHSNWVNPAAEGTLYIPNLMIVKVDLPLKGEDQSKVPSAMRRIARTEEAQSSGTRQIVLDQVLTPGAPPIMLMNSRVWGDPTTEFPKLNSTEVWEVVNPMPDSHPFHLHLVQFQILDRQAMDRDHFDQTKEVRVIGDPIVPDPGELGWKDTVTLLPGTVTRIITKFGPYTGKFVYHCHILEHEDMGMMRPFEIIP